MKLAFLDVTLNHHTHDGRLTSGNLLGHSFGNFGLVLEVLLRIAVTAIDHDFNPHTSPRNLLLDCLHCLLVIVRPVFSAA